MSNEYLSSAASPFKNRSLTQKNSMDIWQGGEYSHVLRVRSSRS